MRRIISTHERRGRGASSSAARTATEIIEPEARDRLIPEKSRAAGAKARGALAGRQYPISNSAGPARSIPRSDGLPLIGPVPGAKGVYAAYGYGGNGITFSFLAARLIGDLIAGKTSPLLRDFAIDRDGDIATGG